MADDGHSIDGFALKTVVNIKVFTFLDELDHSDHLCIFYEKNIKSYGIFHTWGGGGSTRFP